MKKKIGSSPKSMKEQKLKENLEEELHQREIYNQEMEKSEKQREIEEEMDMHIIVERHSPGEDDIMRALRNGNGDVYGY